MINGGDKYKDLGFMGHRGVGELVGVVVMAVRHSGSERLMIRRPTNQPPWIVHDAQRLEAQVEVPGC